MTVDTKVRIIHGYMPGAVTLGKTAAGQRIAAIDGAISGFGTVTLASVTVAGGVATAVCSTGHGFFTYVNILPVTILPVIRIAGATPSGLNGDWRIDSIIDANTFTFVVAGITNQTASGTITAKIAPILGLTKVFSGTNKAAYQFQTVGGSQAFLRLDDAATDHAVCTMYEAMSDVDNGTGATGTINLYGSSVWFYIISDDKGLYFISNYSGLTMNKRAYFGDCIPINPLDGYPAILAEDIIVLNNSSAGVWMCRPYTQASGSLQMALFSSGSTYLGDNFMAFPGPNGKEFVAAPVYVFDDLSHGSAPLRGIMPGLVNSLHVSTVVPSSQAKDLFADSRFYLAVPTEHGPICIDCTGPWR